MTLYAFLPRKLGDWCFGMVVNGDGLMVCPELGMPCFVGLLLRLLLLLFHDTRYVYPDTWDVNVHFLVAV